MRRRSFLRSMSIAFGLAFPLLGASDCAGITGTDQEDNHDGFYQLVTVNRESLPTNLSYVNEQNKLVLTSGIWKVSGTTLRTEMNTYMIVSGRRTPSSGSTPEYHDGTITVSGTSFAVTLDNGRRITGTIRSGSLVTDDAGNALSFNKN